jgi:hypothetical protein
LEKAKEYICTIYSEWLTQYPEQHIFPKMHDLVAHVIWFIERERMYGIISEESFEASHQLLKKMKAHLDRIPDHSLRADVMSRRLQLGTKESVEIVTAIVRKDIKGKKRGEYNTNGRSKNTKKNKKPASLLFRCCRKE